MQINASTNQCINFPFNFDSAWNTWIAVFCKKLSWWLSPLRILMTAYLHTICLDTLHHEEIEEKKMQICITTLFVLIPCIIMENLKDCIYLHRHTICLSGRWSTSGARQKVWVGSCPGAGVGHRQAARVMQLFRMYMYNCTCTRSMMLVGYVISACCAAVGHVVQVWES